ncbi:MAG: CsgG/HfaB family protein, partial [Candidatus Sericytochromatia bacterium]
FFYSFQKQDYKKAVDLLNKHSEENPDDPEPHKWLAKCYNELFMLDLSLKEIEKVKKLEEKRAYINSKEKIKSKETDIIKEQELIETKLDKSQPKIIIINPKKKTTVNDFYLGKKKIRIAVLDFKYKSSHYYKNNITQSFTEYITSKLVNSNIKIAERSQIDEVIKELKFENSEYVLNSTAKKIGKIYGIDYLLLGYVLDFSSETKS